MLLMNCTINFFIADYYIHVLDRRPASQVRACDEIPKWLFWGNNYNLAVNLCQSSTQQKGLLLGTNNDHKSEAKRKTTELGGGMVLGCCDCTLPVAKCSHSLAFALALKRYII